MTRRKKDRRKTIRELALPLLEELGPMTARKMAALLGRNVEAVQAAMQRAHKAKQGAVHILTWERSLGCSGPLAPVWKIGPGPDAPPPEPLSASECMRRWRKRKSCSSLTAMDHMVFTMTRQPPRTHTQLLRELLRVARRGQQAL